MCKTQEGDFTIPLSNSNYPTTTTFNFKLYHVYLSTSSTVV